MEMTPAAIAATTPAMTTMMQHMIIIFVRLAFW
jgi:hypothetical protein